MDNVKLEELLSKIISEDDSDEEICMMVEECKKEDEEKNKKKSILTTSIAADAFPDYMAVGRPDIYTALNKIIYSYPDGRRFVIDTDALTKVSTWPASAYTTGDISNAIDTAINNWTVDSGR